METAKRRVAVVGLSCRFCGADNADEFWKVMENNFCEFSPMESRFPDFAKLHSDNTAAAGKFYNKKAAFLKQDIYNFDPDFFEISHKEARHMDIQQRLLLEVSYEALEDAGLIINGTNTGVFIGGFMQDALTATMQRQNFYNLTQFDATGTSIGMLSGKLSYFYDLHGPSITIDTACSSSLTALHYAAGCISGGECDTAICGGVNILTEPGIFITLSKGNFLSKKSLCHAFGEDADGYARGEGAGVLILKDYDKAIEDKDKIYCEIISSHINHDGHTNGITYPNSKAQIYLMEAAYKKSAISVDDIGYVEAHGTGTQAGDQAELNALAHVFKEKKQKLIVGSVKSNIGHTEAAAGIASVIKGILMLQHKKIPKTLHAQKKNPNIPFEKYKIILADKQYKLQPAKNGRYYIGINSFGFGGANAHIVIAGEDDTEYVQKSRLHDTYIFNISAKSKNSLYKIAWEYAREIQTGKLKNNTLEEICACCATKRQNLEHKLSITAKGKRHLAESLGVFQNLEFNENIGYKHQNKKFNKCAVIFSGMGVQNENMGRELYGHFSKFSETFDKCSGTYKKISGTDLKNIMLSPQKDEDFFSPLILQPYNLAYQISLYSLVKSFGVKIDGFVGHSVGELAAFYCSGLISLEKIFETAYYRGYYQNRLRKKGNMLVLGISEGEAASICGMYPEEISLAAVNGERNIVLSGNGEILKTISEQYQNVFTRFLSGDVPYHSCQMEMIKDDFLSVVNSGEYEHREYDLYSTVYGGVMTAKEYTGHYWWENIRNTVQFYKTLKSMQRDGYNAFVEIGAHPALSYYINEAFANKEYTYTSFAHKQNPQVQAFYKGLSNVYLNGMEADWSVYYGKNVMLPLPKYRWDYSRLENNIVYNQYINKETAVNNLLGQKMNLPTESWESVINLQTHKWLGGHKIEKDCYFPAAAYINMIAECGIKSIKNMKIMSPVILTENEDIVLNLTKYPDGNIEICSTDQNRITWRKNCKTLENKEEIETVAFSPVENNSPFCYKQESIYSILCEKSLNYSGGFQIIDHIYLGENTAVSALKNEGKSLSGKHMVFVIDAMLQSAAMASNRNITKDREYIYLPESFKQIKINDQNYESLYIYAAISESPDNRLTADVYLYNENKTVLVSLEGVTFGSKKRLNTINIESNGYISTWEEITGEKVKANDNKLFFATGDYIHDCCELIKAVIETGDKPANLKVVTTNAMKVLDSDTADNYYQSILWGLCRCIRLEHRNITVTLIDTDNPDDLNSILCDYKNEYELAIRSYETYALRIKKADDTKRNTRLPEGTAVITGASGGLAYSYALHLLMNGVTDIALISRAKSKRTVILSDVLKYYGANAKNYFSDVSDFETLQQSFKQIEEDFPPIKSIFHLAGVSSDTLVVNIDSDKLKEHFASKVLGAENIHRLLNKSQTENLYLFGSLVGLLGNIGQGAYSAANAFLQSYGEYSGCRFIGFGALDTGMSAQSDNILHGFKKQYIEVLDTEAAIQLAAEFSHKQVYIAKLNWSKFLKQMNLTEEMRFKYLKDIESQPDKLKDNLSNHTYSDQIEMLQSFLLDIYAKALDMDITMLDIDRSTETMGINSLSSTLIVNSINRELDMHCTSNQVTGDFSLKTFALKLCEAVNSND